MIKLLAVKLSFIPLIFLLFLPFGLKAQCENDITPPTCQAPADMTIDCEYFATLDIFTVDTLAFQQYFGNAQASDDCPVWTVELTNSLGLNDCGFGEIIRTFKAVDEAGNQSSICQQIITVESASNYTINIPADVYLGDPSSEELTTTDDGICDIVGISLEQINFDRNCNDTIDVAERNWSMVNWCVFEPNATTGFDIPRLDIDGDGNDGDAYTIEVRNDSLFALIPNQTPQFLTMDTVLLQYQQILVHEDLASTTRLVNGKVYNDLDSNCVYDSNESTLALWTVELEALNTGNVYRTLTDDSGEYSFQLCPQDTVLDVRLIVPNNFGGNCATNFMITVPETTLEYTQNIPVHLEENCNLLAVDISAPLLRRCFASNYYVSVCNLSADTTEDVYVAVELDSFLEFQSSTVPETNVSGNLYTFDLPDLAPGECEQIRINVLVSCDAELGQTHCTTAQVFPENDCFPVSPEWSGASLELNAVCQGDSVQMRIKNVGTGNMETDGHYIVVEDVLMYGEGDFRLNSGETETVVLPANGATWALITDPVPFHPGISMPRIAIEGCGGINIPGLTMAFGENDANPDISIDCQQNIGAYDPNDKRVSPAGYGDMHYTEANTDLEYHIRFQNTGTDTAFNIVVLDTLSSLLQAQTVRTGASSHPYNFELLEDGILKFSFENIMLPDSNINEPASHGFVKFRVEQVPDLEDGHVIENSAAIYFDFNEPVITNTTFNTIGREFIEEVTAVSDTQIPGFKLQIMPHPVGEVAQFKLEGVPIHNGQLLVYDLHGQLIKQQGFSSDTFLFGSRQLAKGIYFYRIQQDGIILSTGKLIIQ